MRLSSITIRGMHNVHHRTYRLNNLNYFTGNNGAGKSTVLQAIQLALLGYIPGTDKTKSGIFSHCNGSMMMVELSMDSDNGSTYIINRTWTKTSKSIVATVSTVPDDLDITQLLNGYELPVFNFSEFVSLSPNKMKDWFIQFLPKDECGLDFETAMTSAIAHIDPILDTNWVAECIDHAKSIKSSGIDGVRELHEWLKASLSFKKGDQARIQHTIQRLVHYDDISISEDSEFIRDKIEDLEVRVSALRGNLHDISKNNEIRADIDLLENMYGVTADHVEIDERFITLTEEYNTMESDIAMLLEQIQSKAAEHAAYLSELNNVSGIVEGMGVCPYTNAACSTVFDMYEVACARKVELQECADACRTELADLESKKSKLAMAMNTIHDTISDIKINYAKKELRLASLNQDLPCETVEIESEIESIDSQIREYRDLLVRIESNNKYNELMDSLTSEKFTVEQCMEILKIWIKLTDVNGMQASVMNKPFETMFKSMNDDLKSMFSGRFESSAFNMTEKSNDFSFGAMSGNSYLEYNLMSSGEKCLYMIALLMAIIRTSNAELPVILIDDLVDHLDSSRIQDLFETLYNTTDVQFILAGVADPGHSCSEYVTKL